MIFYFTATGNSLYVAKELSQALGEEKPLSIPQELKRAKTNGEQLIYTDDSDDVAVRNALSEERCNACLACIHACPSGAFELPMGESNPEARFRNEHVSLNEIIAANNLF